MNTQLTPEERFTVCRRCTAPHTRGTPTRVSVEQACRDVGVSPSPYHHWKKLLKENSDLIAQHQIRVQSTAPKRNGMSLPTELQKRIADIASSALYKNLRQIAKALESEGIKVSDNTVRNNLEAAGLYGYQTVVGSDGTPIKKKVILR